jgi:para-aminobenzoate synthetase component 1
MNSLGKNRCPFFFIIAFDKDDNLVFTGEELKSNKLFFDFPEISNYEKAGVFTKIEQFNLVKPFCKTKYFEGFNKVFKHLLRGDTFLANYTGESEVSFDGNLMDLFFSCKPRYKIYLENKFVCFSPETFIKISNNHIFSYPMKGTIDLSVPDAEDIILNDRKETAEHATIVDLIRNDLSMISENVRVKRYRFSSQIKTNSGKILQISSEIKGDLTKNWHEKIGDIIFKILPAGSISGAPKPTTIKIIEEAENYKRNFYTGIAGYFNGYSLDSCVLIRFVELKNNAYFYKAGGGITHLSNPNSEYNELLKKIYVPL